jgi:excisionase family DNA binding protein
MTDWHKYCEQADDGSWYYSDGYLVRCEEQEVHAQRHDDDRLLTVKETAAMLGISRTTLYAWEDAGKITRVPIWNTMVRFRLSDVQAIMAGRTA